MNRKQRRQRAALNRRQFRDYLAEFKRANQSDQRVDRLRRWARRWRLNVPAEFWSDADAACRYADRLIAGSDQFSEEERSAARARLDEDRHVPPSA